MYCAKSADRHRLVAGGSQFLGFRPHHFLFEIRQYDCCACRAKAFAVASPMPAAAPVTSATLFSKDMFMSCLELRFLIHHFRCRRLRIALADCANLHVKRAIVGRHDSSAVRRIPIQACAEIQQSESANMTSSLFLGVRSGLGLRFALAAVAGHGVTIVKVRVLEKLIPNQSIFALTARIWAPQNFMSFIPKTIEVLRVGCRL